MKLKNIFVVLKDGITFYGDIILCCFKVITVDKDIGLSLYAQNIAVHIALIIYKF